MNARGIYVARDVLGQSFELTRDGYRVVVSFPSDERDFLTWQELSQGEYRALGAPSSRHVDRDEWDFVSVHAVQVAVEMETDFAAEEWEASTDEDFKEHVVATLQRGRDAAGQVFEETLAWIRSKWSQPWLGLGSEEIESLGPSRTIELETGAPLRISLNFGIWTSLLRGEEYALTAGNLETLRAHVAGEEAPPLAELFQADAEYLAWVHNPPDAVRAVLMAAIAAEVKVKTHLLEHANADERPLVEFILTNHREVTVTAVDGLYDKLMKTAQGRSLRDENRDVFRELQHLFRLRNAVAHSGTHPSEEEARKAVGAARQAMNWIDGG